MVWMLHKIGSHCLTTALADVADGGGAWGAAQSGVGMGSCAWAGGGLWLAES
jgi:hypothetical protein